MHWSFLQCLQTLKYYEQFSFAIKRKKSTMVRVLNVAEKNDAAKSLADIMSSGRYNRREGFSRFNKIYEFTYNLLEPNSFMIMTSLSGHLLNFEFTSQHKHWRSCSPIALFDAPVQKQCNPDFLDIKRTLEREAKNANKLVIWTDCDREGENIGFEVINVCMEANPRLQVYRAKFSEITKNAVERAVNDLAQPDINTSNAVDVRQELDLRIGAAFTRFQTMRFQKVFPNVLAKQLISYGSCQFPTLGFVVERFKQVQAFVPEPFWKLKVTHKAEDGICEFSWKRLRLFDMAACQLLFDHCIESPTATVLEVKSKPKSKWRPVALDTVELEKLASRKLKINAKETMKIAEKLYTKGFISYPRTETNQFPQDFDLRSLVAMQTQDTNWGEFASGLLETGITPRNGKNTDKAHPPIHPISYTNNLQGNDSRVYEFVVRHFLACCSQDAQAQETTVNIDINTERFHASGLMILAKNYLEVYPYESWNNKTIPVYRKGEQFDPSLIAMEQSETQPPNLLTEADLIALMDKHGIGTDATHAEHIETIKSRLYVGVRTDGKFVPGELGMGLVEGYDAMGYEISKPHLRAELEADLKRICDGIKHKDVVLGEQIQKYKEVFAEACKQAKKIDAALSVYFGDANHYVEEAPHHSGFAVMKCPYCAQDMVLKSKKNQQGYFVSCSGYPKCRSVIWLPSFVIEASVENSQCHQCAPNPVNKIKFKFKKTPSLPPHLQNEYVGCIGGCDIDLNEALSLRLPSLTTSQSHSTQPAQDRSTQSAHSNYTSSHSKRTKFIGGTRQPSDKNERNFHSMSCAPYTSNTANTQSSSDTNLDALESGSVCHCGADAVKRTVRKQGPNIGRQFYSCSKPQDSSRCDFFLWADQKGDLHMVPETPSNNSSSQRSSTNHDGPLTNSADILCKCKQLAPLLKVSKEGPNKGRSFHGCHRGRGQGCNFFQWSTELDTPGHDRRSCSNR